MIREMKHEKKYVQLEHLSQVKKNKLALIFASVEMSCHILHKIYPFLNSDAGQMDYKHKKKSSTVREPSSKIKRPKGLKTFIENGVVPSNSQCERSD